MLLDQTNLYTMSPVDAQTRLNDFQSSAFDSIAFLQNQWMPADWMLAYASEKPMIPWQYLHPAFTPGAVFDYDGSLGKLALFLADLQNSLEVAQQLGSPGLCLDLEFYSNYDWGIVTTGAGLAGISEADYRTALQTIGAQIAQKIDSVFPTAVVWGFQFAISPSLNWQSGFDIRQGFCEELINLNSQVTLVLAGSGEMTPFHPTITDIPIKTEAYHAMTLITLQQASDIRLGTPWLLWQDKNDTASFVADYIAAHPAQPFAVLEDFRPAANVLFNKFKYVWVLNYPLATGWDSVGAEAVPVNAFLQSVKNGQPS